MLHTFIHFTHLIHPSITTHPSIPSTIYIHQHPPHTHSSTQSALDLPAAPWDSSVEWVAEPSSADPRVAPDPATSGPPNTLGVLSAPPRPSPPPSLAPLPPHQWRSSAELNAIEEYEQSCTVALTDALHSVTEHHAFLRTFSSSSLHNTELLHRTRAQFLIQLEHSVHQLQSLIDTQQALVSAVHQSAPATNVLPVIYQEIISTAVRVPDSVAPCTPEPARTSRPSPAARFQFYAVRRGFAPGVYTSWEAARVQVNGFPNNAHRGFHSFNDAWIYVFDTPPVYD